MNVAKIHIYLTNKFVTMLAFIVALGIIVAFLLGVFLLLPDKKEETKSGKILLSLIINQIKITGGIIMLELKATQKVTGELAPVDAKNNPAQVQEGTVSVSSSDGEIVNIVSDPTNPLKFEVVATGKTGVARVDWKADADLGDGVIEISGFTAVEVQAGNAVGFAANFGEPTEQATATDETTG